MNIGKPGDVGQPLSTQRTGAAGGMRAVVGAPVASGEDRIDGSEAADNVTLSDASRALTAQSAGVEVRAAKVAELKLAIEEGRYRPDPGRIADRMVDEQIDLLAAPGRRGQSGG